MRINAIYCIFGVQNHYYTKPLVQNSTQNYTPIARDAGESAICCVKNYLFLN